MQHRGDADKMKVNACSDEGCVQGVTSRPSVVTGKLKVDGLHGH